MRHLTRVILLLAAIFLAGMDASCASEGAADSGFSAGLSVKTEAHLEDIGLPGYPGARPRHDKDNDTPAFSFGLWGGMFGLKVTALEFVSDDSADAIANYYLPALRPYGAVIDCSQPDAKRVHKDDDHTLGCDDEDVKPGRRVLKAGTPKTQHIVEIKSKADRTVFSLVKVVLRGTD